jgi:hypothetical protein
MLLPASPAGSSSAGLHGSDRVDAAVGDSVTMKLISFCAAVEAITGLILIVDPSLVVWLLFGAEVSLAGLAVARVAGFALLALGVACWFGHAPENGITRAARGLLTYNALATIFFFYLVIRSELVGLLLLVRFIALAGRVRSNETANEAR